MSIRYSGSFLLEICHFIICCVIMQMLFGNIVSFDEERLTNLVRRPEEWFRGSQKAIDFKNLLSASAKIAIMSSILEDKINPTSLWGDLVELRNCGGKTEISRHFLKAHVNWKLWILLFSLFWKTYELRGFWSGKKSKVLWGLLKDSRTKTIKSNAKLYPYFWEIFNSKWLLDKFIYKSVSVNMP